MDNIKKQMIEQKLTKLAQLRQDLEDLETDLQEKTRAVIPADVLAMIEEIHAEYEPIIQNAQKVAGQLETDVKSFTASLGETVKVPGLMAVYSPPKDLWDSKALKGYSVAHPEVLEMCKPSKPSVSIRKAK